jgi:hypothetical protein
MTRPGWHDLTGELVGPLRIIRCLGREKGRFRWLVECTICGAESVKADDTLRRKRKPRSCGCIAFNAVGATKRVSVRARMRIASELCSIMQFWAINRGNYAINDRGLSRESASPWMCRSRGVLGASEPSRNPASWKMVRDPGMQDARPAVERL